MVRMTVATADPLAVAAGENGEWLPTSISGPPPLHGKSDPVQFNRGEGKGSLSCVGAIVGAQVEWKRFHRGVVTRGEWKDQEGHTIFFPHRTLVQIIKLSNSIINIGKIKQIRHSLLLFCPSARTTMGRAFSLFFFPASPFTGKTSLLRKLSTATSRAKRLCENRSEAHRRPTSSRDRLISAKERPRHSRTAKR